MSTHNPNHNANLTVALLLLATVLVIAALIGTGVWS